MSRTVHGQRRYRGHRRRGFLRPKRISEGHHPRWGEEDRYASFALNETTAGTTYLQPQVNSIINQNDLSDSYKWIIKPTSDSKFTISTGVGDSITFLGKSSIMNGNCYYSDMTGSAFEIKLEPNNEDNTIRIISGDNNYILKYQGSALLWDNYNSNSTIPDNAKWSLYKVNYKIGDVDMNGSINIYDASAILNISTGALVPNSIQRYLADVDMNGSVNVFDSSCLMQLINGQ